MVECGCTLKVELTGFAYGLDEGCEGKTGLKHAKVWPKQLEGWSRRSLKRGRL